MASSLLLGSLVGIALGLTGAGGGIIAIPLLTMGAGLSQAQAAPIALLATALASSLGAALALRDGHVRYRAALLIGSLGMLTTPAGIWLAHRMQPGLLTFGLIGVMSISAWMMFQRSLARGTDARAASQPRACRLDPITGRFQWDAKSTRLMACLGLVTGATSGMLGIGGGFLVVPALTRWTDLTVSAIVGTSQAVIALVTTVGAVVAMTQRGMPSEIAVPFTTAAMAALIAARLVAQRLPARTIQRVFSLLCAGIALALAFQLA